MGLCLCSCLGASAAVGVRSVGVSVGVRTGTIMGRVVVVFIVLVGAGADAGARTRGGGGVAHIAGVVSMGRPSPPMASIDATVLAAAPGIFLSICGHCPPIAIREPDPWQG